MSFTITRSERCTYQSKRRLRLTMTEAHRTHTTELLITSQASHRHITDNEDSS